MKKYLSFVVGGVMMSSAAMAQTAKVTPNPLRVIGDSVVFNAQVSVPADKVMKKSGTYVLKPELGEHNFPEIRVPSSQLGDAAKNGISVNVRSAMKFDEEMIGNHLEIEHEYRYGKEGSSNMKKVEFKDMDDVGECCITTGRLYTMNTQYNLHKYEYVPGDKNPAKMVVQFNFPQDISTLKKDAYKTEVTEIGKYLKKYKDATVTVKGFASPEGTYERNKTLATERAEVAKRWLIDQLKVSGYGNSIDANKIKVETTVEDWNGLEETLERSNLSYADQERIQSAIANGKNPKSTEDSVISIVGGMDKAEQYLRPLRRSTVVVESKTAQRKAYSSTQIDSIMTAYNQDKISDAALKDVFSKNEYLYASQKTKAESGKVSLMVAYYQQEGGDFKVLSDIGAMTLVNTNQVDIMGGDDAIMGTGFNRENWDFDNEVDFDDTKLKIKQKGKQEDVKDPIKYKYKTKVDFKDGEALLLRAYELKSTDPVILNNLGAYYLSEGEFAKAKDYLTKSVNAEQSVGANYNLGLYYGLTGDYKKSLDYFNKAGDVPHGMYNRAITKLMLDDAAGARKDLTAALKEDPNHMLAHYVMGIVGARMNDIDLMAKHLPIAMMITQNKKLSDATAENLEFRNYWKQDWFQEATDDDMKSHAKLDMKLREFKQERRDNVNDRED